MKKMPPIKKKLGKKLPTKEKIMENNGFIFIAKNCEWVGNGWCISGEDVSRLSKEEVIEMLKEMKKVMDAEIKYKMTHL